MYLIYLKREIHEPAINPRLKQNVHLSWSHALSQGDRSRNRGEAELTDQDEISLLVIDVAVPRPIIGTLSYHMRSRLVTEALIGSWVLVPLSNAYVMGCVVNISTVTQALSQKTREIVAQLHWVPALPPSLVQLVKYLSSYYHIPIGETIKLVMPRWIKKQSDMFVKRLEKSDEYKGVQAPSQLSLSLDLPDLKDPTKAPLPDTISNALSLLNDDGPLTYADLPFYVERRVWSSWRERGHIKRLKLPLNAYPRERRWSLIHSSDDRSLSKRRSAAHEILELLSERESISQHELFDSLSHRSVATLKKHLRALLERGVIELHLSESMSTMPTPQSISQAERVEGSVISDAQIELTEEQSIAVKEIRRHEGFSVTLLHGVTGSGKTEVYLELIDDVLNQGDQALVLIPEIGLTPQTVSRFQTRFKTFPIYAWHSQLGESERLDIWRRLSAEGPCVVIGARSALFTPLRSLALIIVDESHDASYKQGEGVRYHARDMAVMRGSFERCPVILGTATPSLESMYNALTEKYRLCVLKERPKGASLPSVRIIDLTKARAVTQEATSITNTLALAIADRLKRGEQSVLFLNRRGFSQSVRCLDCGYVFACPDCLLPMTWHLSSKRLKCHHCDFSALLPRTCQSCGAESLAPIGRGTEKIEQQLRSLFPKARTVRLDQDSKLNPQELHSLMNSDQVDILIGTQMVTKGHDFPRVTLVGVIDADVGIDLPDFRANERSFQLLSQVAGRAGRAHLQGEVIIQSYRPNEERLLAAIHHDYMRYFSYELMLRETISYPPFGYLAVIRLRAEPGNVLNHALETLQAALTKASSPIKVRGPSLAPINMHRGLQRWLVTLSSPNRRRLHQALDQLSEVLSKLRSRGVHCLVDVDPYDFF